MGRTDLNFEIFLFDLNVAVADRKKLKACVLFVKIMRVATVAVQMTLGDVHTWLKLKIHKETCHLRAYFVSSSEARF